MEHFYGEAHLGSGAEALNAQIIAAFELLDLSKQ